jgi:hypothetical protein
MRFRTMLLIAARHAAHGRLFCRRKRAAREDDVLQRRRKGAGPEGCRPEAFMKTCLSAGGEGAAGKPMNSQQQRMKMCNADAKAKKLDGADRQAFMKSCLSGK